MQMSSGIVKAWLAPAGWEMEGPFHTPGGGPAVPTLREAGVQCVVGRRVVAACTRLGSYGMGGAGLLGIGLGETDARPAEWLVLCLWRASQWCLFDGQPVGSHERSTLRAFGEERFVSVVAGKEVVHFEVQDRWCCLLIGSRAPEERRYVLEVPRDASLLPAYWGTGRRRELAPGVSLWDAWGLSPSDELYV